MKHTHTAHVNTDIPTVLSGLAVTHPDNAAILAPGREPLSFAALKSQLDYVRDRMRGWGIERGDAVAVYLPIRPELAVAVAVLPAAATVIFLDPTLSTEDYVSLFRRCSVKAIVLPRAEQGAARTAAQSLELFQIELTVDQNAPAGTFQLDARPLTAQLPVSRNHGRGTAYILRTSGTTSECKLIPYAHRQIVRHAEVGRQWLGVGPDDLNFHFAPLHLSSGIKSTLMNPILNGVTVFCPPAYDSEKFFTWLAEYSPTWFSASFTVLRDILQHAEEHKEQCAGSGLRFIRSSSGRLEPEEIARLEEIFQTPVITNLSTTETGWISGNPLPPGQRKYGSVGTPMGNETRLVDDGVFYTEAGREGEIVVRGPSVFSGYLDDPAATESAFMDGWYRTGDLGRFDEDGYLYITGRLKEIINSGGIKISPAEIDSVLSRHPAIADAGAFSLPHGTLGEVAVAAVVLEPGADADEKSLKNHVSAHLSKAKTPRKIYVMDRLPRSAAGKLRRADLRDLIARDK